ncbi:hypothetical protein M427DRAFT_355446 [Gonapodya prolifera JEL478]|uniref:Uncharacterized protein n=1 Tax=Gonapodya prolifera (strain JEL478) TaxID=1344416 RepID=A0A139ABP0_GONPJ|nr:hypothetical protein M427DRAFT_355446 [Gonapodya prolifera JEL478]|eukprot:KXS14180.1 hypothetical protein M427DRAFT_355446 [Gonapodya prolifera JEL478]
MSCKSEMLTVDASTGKVYETTMERWNNNPRTFDDRRLDLLESTTHQRNQSIERLPVREENEYAVRISFGSVSIGENGQQVGDQRRGSWKESTFYPAQIAGEQDRCARWQKRRVRSWRARADARRCRICCQSFDASSCHVHPRALFSGPHNPGLRPRCPRA